MAHTPETDAILSTMAASGSTAAEIAAVLGCTRNAVIGRAHRQGIRFVGRPKPAAAAKPARAKVVTLAKPAKKPAPIVVIARPTAPAPTPIWNGPGVTLMELTHNTCRYPLGPKLATATHYCGDKVRDGSVYCAGHHALCYTPREPARPRSDTRVSRFGYLVAAE